MNGLAHPSNMVTGLVNDASDGYMDGMMDGHWVVIGEGAMGGGMMMHPYTGTSGLALAITEFIQSSMNRSGVTVKDMGADRKAQRVRRYRLPVNDTARYVPAARGTTFILPACGGEHFFEVCI